MLSIMILRTYRMEHNDLFIKLKEYRINTFYYHVGFILKTYLEKWLLNNKKINLDSNIMPNFLSVIIEDRPNKLLRFCILNTLIMTRLKMKILLFTSNDSLQAMNEMFSDITELVDIIPLNTNKYDIKKISTKSYNNLMKNSLFWKNIPAENILIFQTDSLLIEPIDFSMFKYNYIGAPFCSEKYLSTSFPTYSDDNNVETAPIWITQVFNRAIEVPKNVAQGNGGLSIRSRELMIKICENEFSPKDENEDIYFSRLVDKYSKNLVPLDIARRFSCECDYYKSIGFHASYLYLSNEQQAEIYERHLKYVITLTD